MSYLCHTKGKDMKRMNALNAAKVNKNDEFYTLVADVIREMQYYDFRDKFVYCNCDGEESAFVEYFINNFNLIGLKKFVATSYNAEGNGTIIIYNGKHVKKHQLNGNGDFRSKECVDILRRCDVVVTNPPFSLARDFFSLMTSNNKKFIILGYEADAVYKNVFPLIRDNKLWTGHNLVKEFLNPQGEIVKFGNIVWWTNVESKDNIKECPFREGYSVEYRKHTCYDNYNAINFDKLKDVPKEYEGYIGVPISYVKYHNPCKYNIVGITSTSQDLAGVCHNEGTSTAPYIKGKKKFARIIIRKAV